MLALLDSRVATDEALMLYQVVASSLHRRLARQDILNDKLKGLKQQRQQVRWMKGQVKTTTETIRETDACTDR